MAGTSMGLWLGYKVLSCFGFSLASTIVLWLDCYYYVALTGWLLLGGFGLTSRLCLASALA